MTATPEPYQTLKTAISFVAVRDGETAARAGGSLQGGVSLGREARRLLRLP
jgi:hypothetical protein